METELHDAVTDKKYRGERSLFVKYLETLSIAEQVLVDWNVREGAVMNDANKRRLLAALVKIDSLRSEKERWENYVQNEINYPPEKIQMKTYDLRSVEMISNMDPVEVSLRNFFGMVSP